MKIQLLLSVALLMLPYFTQAQTENIPDWNLDRVKYHAELYNNMEEWDTVTLRKEIANLSSKPPKDYPLRKAAFPTPKYKSQWKRKYK